MFVEDRAEDAELMELAIEQCNMDVDLIWKSDGEDALEFLNELIKGKSGELPSLIILDMKMVKMDGIELLVKIKSNDNLKRVPVILLTTSKEASDIRKAYTNGANSYLNKPVDFSEFVKNIEMVLNYWLNFNQLPI